DGLSPEVVVGSEYDRRDRGAPGADERLKRERYQRDVLHYLDVGLVIELGPPIGVGDASGFLEDGVDAGVAEVVGPTRRDGRRVEQVREEQVGVTWTPDGRDGHLEVEAVTPVEGSRRLHALECHLQPDLLPGCRCHPPTMEGPEPAAGAARRWHPSSCSSSR